MLVDDASEIFYNDFIFFNVVAGMEEEKYFIAPNTAGKPFRIKPKLFQF